MQIRALTTTALCFGLTLTLLTQVVSGQMPGNFPLVSQTSYMIPENMPPGVAQAMYQQGPAMPPGYVTPVGFCSPSGCDCQGGCDGYGCCGGCSNGPGGLIGQLCQGGELNGLQNLCMFCRGSGCSVCQSPSNAGQLCGWLACLAPYQEAGLCAQRWYDIQAEAMFLSMDSDFTNQAVTSLGQGTINPVTNQVDANVILSTDDVAFDELAAGWRITGSMLFGAGGNIEAIYFGSQHFSEAASVTATLTPGGASTFNLFSAFSNFGTDPTGGFDDTDLSSRQSLIYKSNIHSGEANYRRRWVGPYCRFQGSWLVGFRYFDLDEKLIFDARGALNDTAAATDPRFFNSLTETRNGLVGAQLGGDLWWNVMPGFNLGVGWKGAIFGNRADQNTVIRANSIDLIPGLNQVNEFASDSTTAYLSELQARLAYRMSYAWTFTAAYWLIGVDGVALGAGNFNTGQADQLINNPTVPRTARINIDDSILLNGFSVGVEYIW
ncbi:MAG: BBP7 family outer membrane beta-barrel protein [Pirellulaceae bacterium]